MSQQVETVWLSLYPRPRQLIFDNGAEFSKDFRLVSMDYGIKPKTTTIKNPQANGVLEPVHLVVCNMLRAKHLAELDMLEDDPWMAILASVTYAIRSTYHMTLATTPAQLIFGRDIIYLPGYAAEWDVLRRIKPKFVHVTT